MWPAVIVGRVFYEPVDKRAASSLQREPVMTQREL